MLLLFLCGWGSGSTPDPTQLSSVVRALETGAVRARETGDVRALETAGVRVVEGE